MKREGRGERERERERKEKGMAELLTSPRSHGNEEHSQVEVCNFCGDRGFSNALINCSECCETLVHQYCLGIPPGSIDDSFNWLCEFCCGRMESEPCSSAKSVCASTKGKGKTKKRIRERAPSVLQSEIPVLGSVSKRIRKERTEDQSLSGTTKVAIGNCSNSEDDQIMDSRVDHKMDCSSSCMVYRDDNVDDTPDDEDPFISGESAIIPVVDQPEPLLMVLPVEHHQSSEEEKTKDGYHLLDCRGKPEGALSSLMENPEELMSGMVLLVSPSGEVFIRENSGLCDEGSGIVLLVRPPGKVFTHEGSSLCDEGSGRIFKQGGPHKLKLGSGPAVGEVFEKYRLLGQKCVIEETSVLDMPFLRTNEDIDVFCDGAIDTCRSNVEENTVKCMKETHV